MSRLSYTVCLKVTDAILFRYSWSEASVNILIICRIMFNGARQKYVVVYLVPLHFKTRLSCDLCTADANGHNSHNTHSQSRSKAQSQIKIFHFYIKHTIVYKIKHKSQGISGINLVSFTVTFSHPTCSSHFWWMMDLWTLDR